MHAAVLLGCSTMVLSGNLDVRAIAAQLTEWWSSQTKYRTQAEFADDLGRGRSTVRDWFAGRSIPAPAVRGKLYEITRIPALAPKEAPSLLSLANCRFPGGFAASTVASTLALASVRYTVVLCWGGAGVWGNLSPRSRKGLVRPSCTCRLN